MNLTIFSPIGVRNLTDRQLLVNLTGRDQRVTTGDSWPTFPFLLCVTCDMTARSRLADPFQVPAFSGILRCLVLLFGSLVPQGLTRNFLTLLIPTETLGHKYS